MVLVTLTSAIQLGALERSLITLAAIPLDLLLAWVLQDQRSIQGGALLVGAFLGAIFLLMWSPGQKPVGNRLYNFRIMNWPAIKAWTARLSPVFIIQVKALLHGFPSTALRVALSLAVAYGASILIQIFGYDIRTLPTAIIGMAISALVLSGLYAFTPGLACDGSGQSIDQPGPMA